MGVLGGGGLGCQCAIRSLLLPHSPPSFPPAIPPLFPRAPFPPSAPPPQVGRVYTSIVLGCPAQPTGRVLTNIDRDGADRKRMAAYPYGGARGRGAASGFTVLEAVAGGAAAVVQWKLETGRTHQIRCARGVRGLGRAGAGKRMRAGGGGRANAQQQRLCYTALLLGTYWVSVGAGWGATASCTNRVLALLMCVQGARPSPGPPATVRCNVWGRGGSRHKRAGTQQV